MLQFWIHITLLNTHILFWKSRKNLDICPIIQNYSMIFLAPMPFNSFSCETPRSVLFYWPCEQISSNMMHNFFYVLSQIQNHLFIIFFICRNEWSKTAVAIFYRKEKRWLLSPNVIIQKGKKLWIFLTVICSFMYLFSM